MLAVPGIARAQSEAPQEVTVATRDGGFVRGQIIERRTDGTVIVLMLTGERRAVPPSAVVSIVARGGAAMSGPAASPVAADARGSDGREFLRDPAPGRVALLVESTGDPLGVGARPATRPPPGSVESRPPLPWQRASLLSSNEPLCETPCTLWVRPGSHALRTAAGLVSEVVVPDSGLRVTLRQRNGAQATAGIALISVGALTSALGVLAWAVRFGDNSYPPSPISPPGFGLTLTGALIAGGGVALLTTAGANTYRVGPVRDDGSGDRHQSERPLTVSAIGGGIAPGAVGATVSFTF